MYNNCTIIQLLIQLLSNNFHSKIKNYKWQFATTNNHKFVIDLGKLVIKSETWTNTIIVLIIVLLYNYCQMISIPKLRIINDNLQQQIITNLLLFLNINWIFYLYFLILFLLWLLTSYREFLLWIFIMNLKLIYNLLIVNFR